MIAPCRLWHDLHTQRTDRYPVRICIRYGFQWREDGAATVRSMAQESAPSRAGRDVFGPSPVRLTRIVSLSARAEGLNDYPDGGI